jgi:hypothetical protein
MATETEEPCDHKPSVVFQGCSEGCGEQVKLVTPELASAATDVSVRAICRMVKPKRFTSRRRRAARY